MFCVIASGLIFSLITSPVLAIDDPTLDPADVESLHAVHAGRAGPRVVVELLESAGVSIPEKGGHFSRVFSDPHGGFDLARELRSINVLE